MRKKITHSNMELLKYIVENDMHKDRFTQKDISQFFGVTPSTLSTHIKKIEQENKKIEQENMKNELLMVGQTVASSVTIIAGVLALGIATIKLLKEDLE